MNTEVTIGSLVMKNPVGVASGTFGYGSEYEKLIDVNELGALYTKAVTPEPRGGNPVPRIVETPCGMLNSIGLANPGLDYFISSKLPELHNFSCAVIVNVAGKTEDDYAHVIEQLGNQVGIHGYEINISCPNVSHGGLAFGTDPKIVERLTKRLRIIEETSAFRRNDSRRPLIIKLSPNVTDITEIARAAETGGADAVSAINTLVGMVIDVKKRKPVLAMKTGGLSGPAIRPVVVAAVYKIRRAVSIPVIGLGGIACTDDALQYLLAGADAIQVGTILFNNPHAAHEIIRGINQFMEDNNIKHVADIKNLLQ